MVDTKTHSRSRRCSRKASFDGPRTGTLIVRALLHTQGEVAECKLTIYINLLSHVRKNAQDGYITRIPCHSLRFVTFMPVELFSA